MRFDKYQQSAIDNIVCTDRKISVLVGSAGRGKSTIIKEILKEMWCNGTSREHTYIGTPTGKAAVVVNDMMEDIELHHKAKTIHRLLGCRGPMWEYNEENPLLCDLLIIDEFSMVSSRMFARIIRSISSDARIVLVFDHRQLTPIGAGCPGIDMVTYCNSEIVNKLVVNYRQAAGNLLFDGLENILNKKKITFGSVDGDTMGQGIPDNLFFHEQEDKDLVRDEVSELVKQWHEDKEDYIVLSPQWAGPCGIDKLNERLQERLNPPGDDKDEFTSYKTIIRVGDRVKQTKNDYKLGVFNGFVGTVVDIQKGSVYVDFNCTIYEYSTNEQRSNLTLGYCVSIHSSQGSQYKKVAMIIHSTSYFMLSNQLLYVGASRAMQELHVYGNYKGLHRALINTTSSRRNTYLSEVLGDVLDDVSI